MKKIILTFVFGFLSVPFFTFAASASINAPAVTCGPLTITGTASYTPPEKLRVSFDGTVLSTFVSGETTWNVEKRVADGTHTVTAEALDATDAVIFTATQQVRGACSGTNPALVNQVWGLRMIDTPSLKSGESMVDEHGVSDFCPKWYPMGCADISRTEYYRAQMLSLAHQLVDQGRALQFPIFAGWIAAIR